MDLRGLLPPDFARTVLHGGVVPAAAALFVLAVAWCAAPGRRRAASMTRAAPLAIAAAIVAAQWAARGGIELWPVDATKRFMHLAGAAAVVGLLQTPLRGRSWLALPVVVLGAAASWAILEGAHPHAIGTAWLFVAVVSAGAWLPTHLALLNPLAERESGWVFPAALAVTLGGTSGVLVFGHSAYLAQLAVGLASAIAVCAVAGALVPRFSLAAGGVLVVVNLQAAFLAAGIVYGDAKPVPSILLMAAPFGVWLAYLGPLRTLRPWAAVTVRVALVAGLTGVAVGLAYLAKPPPSPYGY